VISGDNPETVRATVAGLDLPLAREVVAGDELAKSSEPGALIETRDVFGRVAPDQKVTIVQTLQAQGRHVAMIGDGVNDVLPIKTADLGIAMGEGSQASKTVAGVVLENNDFALLPELLEEGRTIVRNLRRSAKLFLTKNVYSFILILAYSLGAFGLPFPYLPQQVTLLNWLVIGIPAFVIALSRERSSGADPAAVPARSRMVRGANGRRLRGRGDHDSGAGGAPLAARRARGRRADAADDDALGADPARRHGPPARADRRRGETAGRRPPFPAVGGRGDPGVPVGDVLAAVHPLLPDGTAGARAVGAWCWPWPLPAYLLTLLTDRIKV